MIVAGGGTAGHIEPAMAVADAITALKPSAQVTALGTERGLETTLVPDRGYRLALIPPVPLPRKLTADLFRLPGRVLTSIRATRAVIDETKADVIVGFGGYVALPAYLAAGRGVLRRRRRVPIVVHEANASGGIANKIGARLATKVLAAVPGSGVSRRGDSDAHIVGIPVRSSITELDRAGLRQSAREYFGLPQDGPVLLVFGGSQGARTLNVAVSGAAQALAVAGIAVLHAHGPKNTLDLSVPPPSETDGPPYIAVPYLKRMDLAYAAADVVVCRSGAMTVAEVSAVGLPAVYVPLPHGNGEQELNARPVVEAGGGVLVADGDFTDKYVESTVIAMVSDTARVAQMSARAGAAGHRDAAATVAQIVIEVATQSKTGQSEAGEKA